MPEVKRLKVKNKLKGFIPYTVSFSDLKEKYNEDDSKEFDIGDEGHEVEDIENKVDLEQTVLQLLKNMDVREKLIFMFQIMRFCGFQIDHTSFARILNIDRFAYMNYLKNVQTKTWLLIKCRGILSKSTQK